MKLIFSKFLILCFLFQFIYSESKGAETTHEIPFGLSISTLAKNLKGADLYADSLIAVAGTDEERIKAMMMKATVYKQQGDFYLSVKTAMHADSIASYSMNYDCQATISGFLAKSFRSLGMMYISSRYLDRAQKANRMSMDSEQKQFTLVDILHERAYHSLDEKDYSNAGKLAISAANQIPKNIKDVQKFNLAQATNDQIMGIFEMKNGELKIADSLLNASLNKLTNIHCSLKPRVYIALGEIALKEFKFNSAHKFLTLVDQYLKEEKDEELEKISYDSWSEYYQDTGNMENALYYSKRSAELLNVKLIRANFLSDSLLLESRSKKEMYRFLYIISMSGLVLLLVFAVYFLLVRKRKNWIQQELPQEFIERHTLTNLEPISPANHQKNGQVVDSSKLNQVKISKYTENSLFRKFEKLEEDKFFLEKNVKLYQVASMMGTNSKYVSYIIQKYRQKDFYEFIQSKRIEYFINLLRNSPELLEFKLSYLAEKCGYLSLSKFSSSFKSITGMPPSTYINLVKKELNN